MWEVKGHLHGAPTMGGVPFPPPIKGPPLLTSHSHLLVKDLSPPLVLFPHGLGLARYMFPVALSGKELLLPLLLERGMEVVGVPDVCAITDAPLLCGAGLGGAGAGSDGHAGAGPAGLHHDLEIGKCTTTSSTSSYLLTKLIVFEGKFSMDVYPPVACI